MTSTYNSQLQIVIDKLDEQISPQTARKMLKAVTLEQQSDMDPYPPAGPANRPPGNNNYSWYVRGFGTRTRTGRSYPTSEKFDTRWDQQVKSNLRVDLVNNASYGGYLMGDPQVGWAKTVGWEKMLDVLLENGQKYRQLAARVIARVNRE